MGYDAVHEDAKIDRTELAALCQAAGSHGAWVQAAGGNASVKDLGAGRLLIKASGLRLSEVTGNSGAVSLDLEKVRELFSDAGLNRLPHGKQQDAAGLKLKSALLEPSELRPSLEAGFHALGSRVTLHTHPESLLGFLCREGGRSALERLFHAEGPVAWVDYRPPGHSLACLVREALARTPGARLVMMKNHGLIVYADSASEALRATRTVAERCREAGAAAVPAPAKPVPAGSPWMEKAGDMVRAAWGKDAVLCVSTDPWLAAMALPGAPAWQPLCPDDLIYCGPAVPAVSPEELTGKVLGPALESGDKLAAVVPGTGVFLAARTARGLDFMQEMLRANAAGRAPLRGLGGLIPLNPVQAAEVLGMESEKYRQGMNR